MLDRGPLVYVLLWALAGAAVGYHVLLQQLLCREMVMMQWETRKKMGTFFTLFVGVIFA